LEGIALPIHKEGTGAGVVLRTQNASTHSHLAGAAESTDEIPAGATAAIDADDFALQHEIRVRIDVRGHRRNLGEIFDFLQIVTEFIG
jgi:hypothetical protein